MNGNHSRAGNNGCDITLGCHRREAFVGRHGLAATATAGRTRGAAIAGQDSYAAIARRHSWSAPADNKSWSAPADNNSWSASANNSWTASANNNSWTANGDNHIGTCRKLSGRQKLSYLKKYKSLEFFKDEKVSVWLPDGLLPAEASLRNGRQCPPPTATVSAVATGGSTLCARHQRQRARFRGRNKSVQTSPRGRGGRLRPVLV
jgi:hypothetical protein